MAAPPKTLKTRKSIFDDLRKKFTAEKAPDLPPKPRPKHVETPVTALRIRHYGITQDQQLTFYAKTAPTFLIGDNHYYIPRCMQASDRPDLDPSIRRLTWTFRQEFASTSTSTTAAKLDSLRGAYSIWYKDPGCKMASGAVVPNTLSQIQGDFWMLKQVQDEPEPGETVEWRDVPKDMLKVLNDDWWFMGVQLPDIEKEAAAAAELGARERRSEAKALSKP